MAVAEDAGPIIENRPFVEIAVGDSASLVARAVTQRDIDLFAIVAGDVAPARAEHRRVVA
jgi:hypothetical protein